MAVCDPVKCEKKCSSHERNQSDILQNKTDIDKLESIHANTVTKLVNIDARLTTFTWICGLLLLSMISLSLYGVVQLNAFKDKYYDDMIGLQSAVLRNSTMIDHARADRAEYKRPNK